MALLTGTLGLTGWLLVISAAASATSLLPAARRRPIPASVPRIIPDVPTRQEEPVLWYQYPRAEGAPLAGFLAQKWPFFTILKPPVRCTPTALSQELQESSKDAALGQPFEAHLGLIVQGTHKTVELTSTCRLPISVSVVVAAGDERIRRAAILAVLTAIPSSSAA
ncbi:hypothetical protein K466DRAFT_571261, partial [Polyporus arcularius HHB13444]